jgi:hypothetical protein
VQIFCTTLASGVSVLVIVSLWESSASTLPANDQPRQGVNTLAGCLAGWLAGDSSDSSGSSSSSSREKVDHRVLSCFATVKFQPLRKTICTRSGLQGSLHCGDAGTRITSRASLGFLVGHFRSQRHFCCYWFSVRSKLSYVRPFTCWRATGRAGSRARDCACGCSYTNGGWSLCPNLAGLQNFQVTCSIFVRPQVRQLAQRTRAGLR